MDLDSNLARKFKLIKLGHDISCPLLGHFILISGTFSDLFLEYFGFRLCYSSTLLKKYFVFARKFNASEVHSQQNFLIRGSTISDLKEV